MADDLTPVEGNPFEASDLTPVEGNPFAPKEPSLSEALQSGVQQLGPSTEAGISQMASAVAHPIDTARSLGHLVQGEYELATGTPPEARPIDPSTMLQGQAVSAPSHADVAQAYNQYLMGRYGSWDGFKKAIATDPFGVVMDLSTVAMGPEAAAARLPGITGAAARVARAVNPLRVGEIPAAATSKLGDLVAEEAGVATGVGSDPVKIAAGAGAKSLSPDPAERAQAGMFKQALAGKVDQAAAVNQSLDAMHSILEKRAANYQAGMSNLPTSWVTDFSPIDQAFQDSSKFSNKGGIVVNRAAASARGEIADAIDGFKQANQGLYTPQNLDALKRSINDVGYGHPQGSPARAAADSVASEVVNQIEKAAPGYSDTMDAYSDATKQIRELKQAFSLGEKGTIEGASRKLNSALRNNVSTSFGYKKSLLDILNEEAPGLSETLAGQSLATPVPRGISRLGTAASLLHLPWAMVEGRAPQALGRTILNLATQSPRLAGNLAYRTGQASALVSPFYRAAASPLTIGGAWVGSSPFLSPISQSPFQTP